VALQSLVVETLATEETLGMTLARQGEMIVKDEILEIEIITDQSGRRLLTMIGNVKSVVTLIFRLELNVIGVENLSQVAEEITETVDQEEIIEVAAETVGHAETTVQVEIVVEATEVAGHAENEDHAETTVQVEIIVEATEVAGHAESVGQVETVGEATETVDQEEKEVVAESETQTFVNSVVLEANHQGMLTTEDHNPLIPVRLEDIEMIK
jgi:hypothetical protein